MHTRSKKRPAYRPGRRRSPVSRYLCSWPSLLPNVVNAVKFTDGRLLTFFYVSVSSSLLPTSIRGIGKVSRGLGSYHAGHCLARPRPGGEMGPGADQDGPPSECPCPPLDTLSTPTVPNTQPKNSQTQQLKIHPSPYSPPTWIFPLVPPFKVAGCWILSNTAKLIIYSPWIFPFGKHTYAVSISIIINIEVNIAHILGTIIPVLLTED